MVNVFIKSDHRQKGMGRFLESLQIDNQIQIIDVKQITDVNRYPCETAIFGGFLPNQVVSVPNIRNKYYTFCSPFGQADMSSSDFYSAEIRLLHELQWYTHYGHITNVVTQSKSLSSRFNYIYIPPVKIIDDKDIHYNTTRKGYSLIGNNYRKHRNVVNQLAAVSAIEPKEEIIVSNTEDYKGYKDIFTCNFVARDLQSDADYYKEIASHRLAFQCSWSEAFSYITLEYAFMGVPTICSPCIDWYPYKNCIVDNVDNWQNIKQVAESLLADKTEYWIMSHELSLWAKEFNDNNINQLKEVIYENFTKRTE